MIKRPLKDLEYIIVHHTASDYMVTVDQIRAEHLKRGWADIGYHFVVGEDGLHVGRDIHFRGAHCVAEKYPYSQHDFNWISIGIVIGGDYSKQDPSEKLINELAYAVKRIAEKYKIPLDRDHILGHKDVSYTLCPGTRTMEMLYKKLEI